MSVQSSILAAMAAWDGALDGAASPRQAAEVLDRALVRDLLVACAADSTARALSGAEALGAVPASAPTTGRPRILPVSSRAPMAVETLHFNTRIRATVDDVRQAQDLLVDSGLPAMFCAWEREDRARAGKWAPVDPSPAPSNC